MASQTVGHGSRFELRSFVRGYHEYKDVWLPTLGEMLLLEVESGNWEDQFAVAVVKDGLIVGHIPKHFS